MSDDKKTTTWTLHPRMEFAKYHETEAVPFGEGWQATMKRLLAFALVARSEDRDRWTRSYDKETKQKVRRDLPAKQCAPDVTPVPDAAHVAAVSGCCRRA